MSAAKIRIASTSHSFEDIASILADYTNANLVNQTQLFGGYSGCSYRIELDDDRTYVVKVQTGYSYEHAELMCRTTNYLGENNNDNSCSCCLPIPLLRKDDDDNANDNNKYTFVSKKEKNGAPALLLTYIKGKQADAVMREYPHLGPTVMKGIGGGLARIHSATSNGITQEEATTNNLRWYQSDGGCCDVQDQIDDKVLSDILSCKDEKRRDDFLNSIYTNELSSLKTEMQLVLSHGITHGDPFADNVLVNELNGEFSSFIDIEDVCIGPILFDLCCCAIGCCFTPVLDYDLLDALLDGYTQERKLSQIERDHFIPFMRLTLLCNCSWRFVKFNVKSDSSVPEEVKDSYLELQRRIEYLHDPDVIQKINTTIQKTNT